GGAVSPGGYPTSSGLETTGIRVVLRERNTLATLMKCYGASMLCVVLPLYVAQSLLVAVLLTIIGKGRTARGVMRALTWNARHVRATMAARSIVQRSRQTPDRDILKRMFKGNRKLSLLFSVGMTRDKEVTASTWSS